MLQIKIKFRLLILYLFPLLVLIIHEYRLQPLFQTHIITIISTNLFSDDETDGVYVDPDITDSVNYQQPVMPPMPSKLSTDQVYTAYIWRQMHAGFLRMIVLLGKGAGTSMNITSHKPQSILETDTWCKPFKPHR